MEATFAFNPRDIDYTLTLRFGMVVLEYHFPTSTKLTMTTPDQYNTILLRWPTGEMRLCTRWKTQFTICRNVDDEDHDDLCYYQRIVVSPTEADKIIDAIKRGYAEGSAEFAEFERLSSNFDKVKEIAEMINDSSLA